MHTLIKNMSLLEKFRANHLFGKEHGLTVDCKTLMSRMNNRQGAPDFDLFIEQQAY